MTRCKECGAMYRREHFKACPVCTGTSDAAYEANKTQEPKEANTMGSMLGYIIQTLCIGGKWATIDQTQIFKELITAQLAAQAGVALLDSPMRIVVWGGADDGKVVETFGIELKPKGTVEDVAKGRKMAYDEFAKAQVETDKPSHITRLALSDKELALLVNAMQLATVIVKGDFQNPKVADCVKLGMSAVDTFSVHEMIDLTTRLQDAAEDISDPGVEKAERGEVEL